MLPSSSNESDNVQKAIRSVTWVGIWVNLVLSVFKILAGVFGTSKALIADGLESSVDIVTSLVLVVASRYWAAPPDREHPYGHRRIETMVTLWIGISVGAVGISITIDAIQTLHNGTHSHPTLIALVMAVVSVVSKEILFQWSVRKGQTLQSMSLVANAWHHRSDAISSIPVVIAVGTAQWYPEWSFLDPLGAVVAAGFILKASAEILWPTLREMMDTAAPAETTHAIARIAGSVSGVLDVHDIRTRYVGHSIQADLHIVVPHDITVLAGHQIAEEVMDKLKRDGPGLVDVLVHIDPWDDHTLPRDTPNPACELPKSDV